MLPRIFHIDFPEELSQELMRCRTDEQVRQVGIEWGVHQASGLKEAKAPSIHFYAMHAYGSVAKDSETSILNHNGKKIPQQYR